MKRELLSSLILTVLCILFFAGIYPFAVWGIAQLEPNRGEGMTVTAAGKRYYSNIGQKFTADQYFWSRPSAVDYNAAGSGGSNKGPSNPDYLATVQQRIDTFMAHNPGINKADIPSDIVTASGSGLDPDISVEAAMIQVQRIASVRRMEQPAITALIKQRTLPAALGMGPNRINVLDLNLQLDRIDLNKDRN